MVKEDKDVGMVTEKEFKLYQKVEIIKGTVEYLRERVYIAKSDLSGTIIVTCLGTVVGGVGVATASNTMGIAGLGITVLAGALSLANYKRCQEQKGRLERSRNHLKDLESSSEYQNLEKRIDKSREKRPQ